MRTQKVCFVKFVGKLENLINSLEECGSLNLFQTGRKL